MKASLTKLVDRRSFLKGAAAGAAGLAATAGDVEAVMRDVNTRSRPANLEITDLRVAAVGVDARGAHAALIKLDTNQGIVGLGEMRAGADPRYALMLKSRVLGKNPCNVDQVFREIKRFGGHSHQGGGVSGVETALWDLAGKAYGVPVWRMLGGKFRDQVRVCAHTPGSQDPEELARRLKARVERGYTFLEMDLGCVERRTGEELTRADVDDLIGLVESARSAIGMDVALAAGHRGHIGVDSCIRLGRALEKYNLAWLEGMVPWQHMGAMKTIAESAGIPLCAGGDIYLKEHFRKLVDMRAVDIVRPDAATCGGLLEAKKIGDSAQEGGAAMALHCAGTPVSFMASVHCAAATENFVALERRVGGLA